MVSGSKFQVSGLATEPETTVIKNYNLKIIYIQK